MNIPRKLWFLNIVFLLVIIVAIVLVFLDKPDSTTIISVMIGIPLAAYAAEMGVYSHHTSKDCGKKK